MLATEMKSPSTLFEMEFRIRPYLVNKDNSLDEFIYVKHLLIVSRLTPKDPLYRYNNKPIYAFELTPRETRQLS